MKYNELSKIALSLAAKVLVKAVGVYDLGQLREIQDMIIADIAPLSAPEPVDDKLREAASDSARSMTDEEKKATDGFYLSHFKPEPVDDKALAEALHRAESGYYMSPEKGCMIAAEDNRILAQALRAARKEVAELRKDKERLDWMEQQVLASGYVTEIRGGYRFQSNGIKITTGVGSGPHTKVFEGPTAYEPLRAAIDKARAAGEGKGAT